MKSGYTDVNNLGFTGGQKPVFGKSTAWPWILHNYWQSLLNAKFERSWSAFTKWLLSICPSF